MSTEMCLAATGATLPTLAVGIAVTLMALGLVIVLRHRRRHGAVLTALIALLAVGTLVLAPSAPASAATTDLGSRCTTAADSTTPPPAVPPITPPTPPAATGAVLGDFAWIDTNRNGLQDPGELPAVGVRLSLLDAVTGLPVTIGFDGTTIDPIAITGADGRYSFGNLPAGSYLIDIDPGLTVVGEQLSMPYGFYTGTLSIRDANGIEVLSQVVTTAPCSGNGYFSVSLPGPGHTATLTPAADPTIATSSAYASLTVADAGDDQLDSDLDFATGRVSAPIVITDGQTITGIDIGLDPAVGRYDIDFC